MFKYCLFGVLGVCGVALTVECVNSVVWVVSCVFVVVAGLLILYSFSWLFVVILVCSWWLIWCGLSC